MGMIAYLLARFSEPSSFAGLGAMLALAGWNIPDPVVGQLVQLLAAACGMLALLLKERGLIRAIVLVFAVAPVLAACGGVPIAVMGALGSAGAAYTAIHNVDSAASPLIATACDAYAKAKAAAGATTAAATVADRLASIESFGDAACASQPEGDPTATAIWLGELANQLASLSGPSR